MLMPRTQRWIAAACVALLAAGCTGGDPAPTTTQTAIADVRARSNSFPDYPQPNTTYLSFSKAHGFQVNYLAANGKSWLWYPGNRGVVPELYKTDTVGGRKAICWKHPSNSYNPVTQTKGGGFQCEPLALAQRTIIAARPGDPFSLATGRVPYRLDRCAAPDGFRFDRSRYSC